MRRLPLLPLAPLLVVVVGLGSAIALFVLGVSQIRRTSDEEAQHRAKVVADAMAARLRLTALEDRGPLIADAARAADVDLLLVSQDGQTVSNASLEDFARERVVEMLVDGEGDVEIASGRQRFASHPLAPPLENLSVIAMVAAPETPPETYDLARTIFALTALLVGVAAIVTYSYARATQSEVVFVRGRIGALSGAEERGADVRDPPLDKTIPIRAFDEVGALTLAFNTLLGRFQAAEKSFRADVSRAARDDHERLEFLAGLSHELRTPLNAILGFSHVLESGVDGPLSADNRESIEVIRTSGEHLRTLIDDILDLSALETGELKLTRRPVELRQIVDEVVREANALARHKGLTLSATGKSYVVVNADKRRVRQILTNLVSNAVKYTPRGAVTIRVASDEQVARVEVEDTGYGIAAEDLGIIFEAYRQAASGRARPGGVGLGLATVKRLVELHGGAMGVESVEGRGSSFHFTLPLATDEQIDAALTSRGSITSVLPPEPKATT